jgi:hypothetical protein
MFVPARLIAAVSFAWAVGISTAAGLAQAAPTSPAPAASATPAAVSDPCGSLMSIVNRPTIGTGVCTVQTGKVDLENGYTSTVVTGPGGSVTGTYPQSLIRFGTFDPHLDFEFGAPSYNTTNAGGAHTSGWGDISFGAKYELGYTAKTLYGINAVVTIPTGKAGFSAGNAQYTGNFNFGYTLNSEFGLSGTLGFNALSGYAPNGLPQSYFSFIPSLEGTAALPGGPSQLFGEYAYFSQAGVGLGSKSVLDFGYARDFGSHVQFDVEYGFTPTVLNGQKQHYVGAGLSFMN